MGWYSGLSQIKFSMPFGSMNLGNSNFLILKLLQYSFPSNVTAIEMEHYFDTPWADYIRPFKSLSFTFHTPITPTKAKYQPSSQLIHSTPKNLTIKYSPNKVMEPNFNQNPHRLRRRASSWWQSDSFPSDSLLEIKEPQKLSPSQEFPRLLVHCHHHQSLFFL